MRKLVNKAFAPRPIAALRSRIEAIVDELLAPAHGEMDVMTRSPRRVAREDLALGACAIEPGSLLLVGIGAANHDPDVFPEPGRLDIGRDPNPHLAFGFGAHFCLGAPLARLEGEIAVRALLERFLTLTRATEAPQYRPSPVLRGLASLPIRC